MLWFVWNKVIVHEALLHILGTTWVTMSIPHPPGVGGVIHLYNLQLQSGDFKLFFLLI